MSGRSRISLTCAFGPPDAKTPDGAAIDALPLVGIASAIAIEHLGISKSLVATNLEADMKSHQEGFLNLESVTELKLNISNTMVSQSHLRTTA